MADQLTATARVHRSRIGGNQDHYSHGCAECQNKARSNGSTDKGRKVGQGLGRCPDPRLGPDPCLRVRAFARVLTLVVVTKAGLEEEAIEAANDASAEHPCRIIVLADVGSAAPNRVDALRWWASAAGRGRTRISPPR